MCLTVNLLHASWLHNSIYLVQLAGNESSSVPRPKGRWFESSPVKNNLVVYTGSGYGKMYFPSDLIEKNKEYFDEIWGKIGKKKK